jgi:hypothetical protein
MHMTLNRLFRVHKFSLLTKILPLFSLCSGNPLISFDEFRRSVQLYGQLISMHEDPWARFEEAINILEGTTANQLRYENTQTGRSWLTDSLSPGKRNT